jgi:hypothetical protein
MYISGSSRGSRVAERVQFYHASETVNEDLIVRRLDRHGRLVCWATEVPLEPVYLTTDRPACYRGDVLALFEGPRGHTLVGIEVKDWDARVSIPMARGYLETYGKVCQNFYLAANGFAQGLFSLRDLGLFHLDRREVVKAPGPLVPDPILWRSAVERLCDQCQVEIDLPRDPSQSTLSGVE